LYFSTISNSLFALMTFLFALIIQCTLFILRAYVQHSIVLFTILGQNFDEMPELKEDDEIRRITNAKSKLEKRLEKVQTQLLEKEHEIAETRAKNEREKEILKEAKELLKQLRDTVQAHTNDSADEIDKKVQSSYNLLWEEIRLQHSGAVKSVERLVSLNSKLIRKTETDLWKKHSDVLHMYVEFLLKTNQLPMKAIYTSMSDIDENVTEEHPASGNTIYKSPYFRCVNTYSFHVFSKIYFNSNK